MFVGDAVALAQERIEAVVARAAADALAVMPHLYVEHTVFEDDRHEALATKVHDGQHNRIYITDEVKLAVYHLAGVQAIGVNPIVGDFQIDRLAVEISNGRVASNIILFTTRSEQQEYAKECER